MTLAEQWNGIIDEVILQCKTLDGLKDELFTNAFNATNGVYGTNNVFAVQITGLTPAEMIDSLDLNVIVADGNVRVKVYTDSRNAPDLLLGESDSIPVTGTGVQNFRFTKQVEVPIDGQLWFAFETDSATLDIVRSTGQASGTSYSATHTFGDGPDPWSGGIAGTTPFWTQVHNDPKVVKYNGQRGKQTEDFFAVVWAESMKIESLTNRGSNNEFVINIDLSYRGVDFQNAMTKMLSKSSEIYDAIHMTTLNNKVQKAVVNITPDEVLEGENLYMVAHRITVTSTKVVIQP
jgi:hypothetical protein